MKFKIHYIYYIIQNLRPQKSDYFVDYGFETCRHEIFSFLPKDLGDVVACNSTFTAQHSS